jgi:hypothetical protein
MSDVSDGMKGFVDQFRAQADENIKHLVVSPAQLEMKPPFLKAASR